MKKISILSLMLLGGLYISNAKALQVDSHASYFGGRCLNQSQCARKLTRACDKLHGSLVGDVTYTTSNMDFAAVEKICYNCSAKCVAGTVTYSFDTTTLDKPTTLSEDPNFGTTTSTTAPKSKNLKK